MKKRGGANAAPKSRPAPRRPKLKETATLRQERADRILAALKQEYPEPRCALNHHNAYELLVATILSAQCTDVRVNMVTPELFRRFPDPKAMAAADAIELRTLIQSTGFFNNKTKSLLGATSRIMATYGGSVPDTMEDLLSLPGVARKTANVILGTWFKKNEGVVVDTHVDRLSHRFRLTAQHDPVKIERDLMGLFPREEWTNLSHRLIQHGRQVCAARLPRCGVCVLGPDICPSYEPDPKKWTEREAAGPSRKRAPTRRKVKAPASFKKTARTRTKAR
jgi:endonuclease III